MNILDLLKRKREAEPIPVPTDTRIQTDVQNRPLFQVPQQGQIPLQTASPNLFQPVNTVPVQSDLNTAVQTPGGVLMPRQETPLPNNPNPLFNVNPTNPEAATINQTPEHLRPIESAQLDYEQAVGAKPEKQGVGKQILFQVLRGISDAASGRQTPFQWLGEAKREAAINQAQGRLAPLQQQEQYQNQQDLINAQTQQKIDAPKLAREKILADIQKQIRAQQARMNVINRQADIRSGEAKIFIDAEGKQWKQFLKPDSSGNVRPMEPIVNPTTGEQEFAPGEQMVDWTDPLTGATSKIKAKQALMPGATLASGNAQREQQTNITNVNNDFEAQKTNATATANYNKTLLELAQKEATASGELDALNSSTKGLNEQMDAKLREFQNIVVPEDTDSKEYAEAVKRRNQLVDDYNKLNGQLYEAVGKTQGGQRALQQLQSLRPSAPTMVAPKKVNAVKVGGGIKTVPKSKDPLGLFQ